MWTKLDDALLDHRKIFDAGELIGKNGPALALSLYVVGLMWTNKQLSDGFLPTSVVKHFRHCDKPLDLAQALVDAHLWEAVAGGYKIHDFHEFNFTAAEVNARRKEDRERKRKGGRNSHGRR